MQEKKIYTAFVSSAFESLRDEREQVIRSLLDFRVLPIGQEHFTVTDFRAIQEFIDESDYFILLLGGRYGSIDKETGLSWTEREYRYAIERSKPVLALICEDLAQLREADPATLTEDQQRQVVFCNELQHFARTVTEEFSIHTIVTHFISGVPLNRCPGWVRVEILNEKERQAWREQNQAFDIGGTWYHVHLNDKIRDYIRIGTVEIRQDFSPDTYQQLYFDGENFGVEEVNDDGSLEEDLEQHSRFYGDYKLEPNGKIFGIFFVKRNFDTGEFDGQQVSEGEKRGIHDFMIRPGNEPVKKITGEFHDEAPSKKHGRIYLFREKEDRDKFVLKKRAAELGV